MDWENYHRSPPIKVTELTADRVEQILGCLRQTKQSLVIGQHCSNGHPWEQRIVIVEKGKPRLRCEVCRKQFTRLCYERTPSDVIHTRNHTPQAKSRRRDNWLKFKYNMSFDDWINLWMAQGGKCAIENCGFSFPIDQDGNPISCADVHVDHDHVTNTVRRLLCARCNRFIGVLEDPLAPFLLTYLLEHGSYLGRSKDLLREGEIDAALDG